MIIRNNIPALTTANKSHRNNKMTSDTMEKLSSGLRINKAADDAAGLAISEKMRAQIRGLEQAERNIQDGISLIQTVEGGLGTIQEPNLQRLRELTIQASNGTLTDEDRQQIQKEVEQIKKGINEIANNTEFNGIKLLNVKTPVISSVKTENIPGEDKRITITINTGDTPEETVSNIIEGFNQVKSGAIGDSEAERVASGFNLTQPQPNQVKILNIRGEGHFLGFNSDTNITYVGGWSSTFQFNGIPNQLDLLAASNIVDNSNTNDPYDDLYFKFQASPSNELSLQVGTNLGDKFSVDLTDVRTQSLGIDDINLSTRQDAQSALSKIDKAMETISSERGKFGAYQNGLEHIHNNVSNYGENLTAAESRIRDIDMAKGMVELTKNNIISQATQAMLSQANQTPEQVLQLLN